MLLVRLLVFHAVAALALALIMTMIYSLHPYLDEPNAFGKRATALLFTPGITQGLFRLILYYTILYYTILY